VSEYGKLCAKYPDRAKEVKTGAFNTVHVGQTITVESTAEGRGGDYYEMVATARKLEAPAPRPDPARLQVPLLRVVHRRRLHARRGCRRDERDAGVFRKDQPYVVTILGRPLSKGQRAWYVKKAEQQGDAMKQEFPSTPDEAFDVALEGAYLGPQMRKMRAEGRICRIPILDIPVYTTWDLGVGDAMTITFWQDVGLERRAIDYLEASGEGFGYYAAELTKKGYNYERHYMPHDADHRRLGKDAKSAKQHAEETGIKPITVLPRIATELDGIEASRALLPSVWIDEERCARLITCLDSYRKEWDDKGGVWKDKPVHDQYSHGYKSFESAAIRKPALPKNDNGPVSIPRLATAFGRR
jgi:hypothetical protein